MKEVKNKIIDWLKSRLKFLKGVSIFLNFIAGVALICWLFKLKCKFAICDIEWEASFAILTILIAGIGQLYRWLLAEVLYSPATALAIGYVNNFIEPLIVQLKENGEKEPAITVYVPEDIIDLYPNNIDRIKAEIKNKDFQINEIKLEIKHARARDILLVEKSKTKKMHFDFPNTLTSLIGFIDYSIGSKENESIVKKKEEFTKKIIAKFFEEVDSLLKKKKLDKYVKYCDHKLDLGFQ